MAATSIDTGTLKLDTACLLTTAQMVGVHAAREITRQAALDDRLRQAGYAPGTQDWREAQWAAREIWKIRHSASPLNV